jgi:hypothetical protein
MKKKANDLLAKIPELVVKTESDSGEEEEEGNGDVEMEKSIQEEKSFQELENTNSVSGMESKDGHSDGDGDVEMEGDEEEEDELEEDDDDKPDFTTDSNHVVQRWKERTNLIRARYLKFRQEQLLLPFPERAAVFPSDASVDAYLYHYNWFIERQQIMYKHIHENLHEEDDFTNPCFSYHFLPELYPFGIPVSNMEAKPFQNDLEHFFKAEDTVG